MDRHCSQFLVLCGIGALLLGACNTQAEEAKGPRHRWFVITFPTVPCPWIRGTAQPALYPSDDEKEPGIRLNMFLIPDEKLLSADDFVEPKPSELKIRMHYADGRIVPAESLDILPTVETGPRAGTKKNVSRGLQCVFPWGPNDLQEAWIEVRFPNDVVWLALPYGFTRNPNDALCPQTKAGPPQFAPAMKPLAKNAKLANWQRVAYNYRNIQNGWRLSMSLSNPGAAHCDVELYREDNAIGKSMFLWDLHTPGTSAVIHQSNGLTLKSLAKGIRLSDDGHRRIDTFDFNVAGGSDDERTWGTFVVKVDDESYDMVIASSLFGYVHGIADSQNEAYLPATPEIRD